MYGLDPSLETALLKKRYRHRLQSKQHNPSTQSAQVNWYILSTRPYKRDLFLKYLEQSISEKQLQELIPLMITPQDAVYQDMVLVQLKNFQEARSYLQQIEYFQRLEPKPISPEQVRRMSGSDFV